MSDASVKPRNGNEAVSVRVCETQRLCSSGIWSRRTFLTQKARSRMEGATLSGAPAKGKAEGEDEVRDKRQKSSEVAYIGQQKVSVKKGNRAALSATQQKDEIGKSSKSIFFTDPISENTKCRWVQGKYAKGSESSADARWYKCNERTAKTSMH